MLLLKRDLVRACLEAAASAHPNEFIGLLMGEKDSEGNLVLARLSIPAGIAVDEFTAQFSHWQLPLDVDYIGTFHSHPSGGASPSQEDVMAASKEGGVHLIAAYPYSPKQLAAHDARGKPMPYRIIP